MIRINESDVGCKPLNSDPPTLRTADGITIHFAICVEPNPGPGVRAMLVTNGEGDVIHARAQRLDHRAYTNNEFAYRALVAVLRWVQQNASEPVRILTDQELLTKQISGVWECHASNLQPLRNEATRLLQETGAELRYVPARENTRARLLCRLATADARRGERGAA